jgi:hypothetical protein
MMMAAEAEQQRPGRQGERLKKAEWLAAEGTTTTPVGFREDAGFVALMMRFSLVTGPDCPFAGSASSSGDLGRSG